MNHAMPSLDVARLRAAQWLGEVDHQAEVASTNDRAIERLRRGDVAAPALVVADAQTTGRGRGTNRWWSAAGGLTFSLIVDAAGQRLDVQSWPRLALTAATAVAAVLGRNFANFKFGIRWPNDVFIDDRKISGILVEAPAVASHDALPPTARHLVLGIGLNLNNSMTSAPDDVKRRATSIVDLTGAVHDPSELLLALLDEIHRRLVRLADRDDRLAEEWRSLCLLRGRTVAIEAGRRRVRGTCHGIQADGALAIDAGASVERFYGGVVSEVV